MAKFDKSRTILVTNDDGITSKGIKHLINWASAFGTVLVVAPDSPQSGMGHAITLGDPLRIAKVDLFDGIEAYQCSGTPADCVKMAMDEIAKDRKIDFVVSGVNHGSNTSISVLYSGTMSAAIEAALEHLPAVGFSLCDYGPDVVFDHIEPFVKTVIEQVIDNGIEPGIALNVNFPAKQNETIKGMKICRQANARWQEEFLKRNDPYGREYYWMTGNFVNHDKEEDNDEWAIANNYVSIVPCKFDLTAYKSIKSLQENWDQSKLS